VFSFLGAGRGKGRLASCKAGRPTIPPVPYFAANDAAVCVTLPLVEK